jgi:hypothetical protein
MPPFYSIPTIIKGMPIYTQDFFLLWNSMDEISTQVLVNFIAFTGQG